MNLLRQKKYFTKIFSDKPVLVLLFIFLISVLIRLPNINRPLSKHHEFVTAISLQVITIWQTDGAAKYHFNPVMTYPGIGNKYINKYASTTGKMVDKEGNFYYVSHPPFAYILPYVVFKIFHIKASVLSIEIFSLVINFITALFVYLIICSLKRRRPFDKTDSTGLTGYMAYLFSAGVLWFQCNTYMSDILVHCFFVIDVFFLIQLAENKKASHKYLFLFSFFLFLMIYTSWLGIFYAFCVFLYSIFRFKNHKVHFPVALITVVTSITAVALFVYQYSLINGFSIYIDQMKNRLNLRSGWKQSSLFIEQTKGILLNLMIVAKNYLTGYLPFILLLAFLVFRIREQKRNFIPSGPVLLFIWISVMPVALLHFFLLDYSGHDFVELYGSLFLSVAIALLFEKHEKLKTISATQLRLLLSAAILLSIASYYYINRPGKISVNGFDYSISKQLGMEIKKTSTHDAVVFAIGNARIDPQLMYYAQRNIKEIKAKEEAVSFLKKRNLRQGFIYYSSDPDKTTFDKIEAIYVNGQP